MLACPIHPASNASSLETLYSHKNLYSSSQKLTALALKDLFFYSFLFFKSDFANTSCLPRFPKDFPGNGKFGKGCAPSFILNLVYFVRKWSSSSVRDRELAARRTAVSERCSCPQVLSQRSPFPSRAMAPQISATGGAAAWRLLGTDSTCVCPSTQRSGGTGKGQQICVFTSGVTTEPFLVVPKRPRKCRSQRQIFSKKAKNHTLAKREERGKLKDTTEHAFLILPF